MRPRSFAARLTLSLAASLATALVFRWCLLSLGLAVPPWAFFPLSSVPYVAFVGWRFRKREFSGPGWPARSAAAGAASTFFLVPWAIVAVSPPDWSCPIALGSGELLGRPVTAYGVCGSFFHEYEEWIEIHRDGWNWIGYVPSNSKVGVISPSDFGVAVDPKTESLAFPSPPTRVEFDGSAVARVFFMDGTSRSVSP